MLRFSRSVAQLWLLVGLAAFTPRNGQAQVPQAYNADMPATMRGFLGVQLNRDNLTSVQRRLGHVSAWATGDAGNAEVLWCYRTQSREPNTVLLFSSDGEMGGLDHEVDEIRLFPASNADTLLRRCSVLRGTPKLSTPGGLRLGLSRAAVDQLLGPPKISAGDSVSYAWTSRRVLGPTDRAYAYWNSRRKECFEGHAPYIDVSAGLIVQFDDTGVVAIHLSRFDDAIC